jgi:FKBP-type peptidyl-prolyl cis-trans isomerase SlyD
MANEMTVAKDMVVGMKYSLKNDEGVVLDSTDGRDAMLFIQGYSNIIPELEKAMEGKEVGYSFELSIEPVDAYGEHHEEGIQEIPKDAIEDPDTLEIGMQLNSKDEEGNEFAVHVKEIQDEVIVIDANHPLAGVRLHFDVTIDSIREATKEELAQGWIPQATEESKD